MITRLPWALSAVVLATVLLTACGGGGGPAPVSAPVPGPAFTLAAISPAISPGLDGGQTVVIEGTNFLGVDIAQVTFGGSEGGSVAVLDDGNIEVIVPPSPGGATEVVDVIVRSSNAGEHTLQGAFRYQGPPQPFGIGPALVSPTGLTPVTIAGEDLGLPSDEVIEIDFGNIATLTGTLNPAGDEVTAFAPVTSSPPIGFVQLTVRNSAGQEGVLGGQLRYDWSPPVAIPVPNQSTTVGGASEPVRLEEGSAVFCTAGPDTVWRTADDALWLLSGLPYAPNLQELKRNATTAIGYLHPAHSRVAVLDGDTVCLYSTGTDGTVRTVLDRITIVDGIGGSLIVGDFTLPFLVEGPVTAVSSDRVAVCSANGDGIWNNNDLIQVVQFNGIAPVGIASATVGPLDSGAATGASISVPMKFGSQAVLLRNVGGNGAPGGGDDVLFRAAGFAGPGMQVATAAAGHLIAPPIVLPGSTGEIAVAPSAGGNGVVGDSDDTLLVYTVSSGLLNRTSHAITAGYNPAAIVPAVGLGDIGVVLAVKGAKITAMIDAVVGTQSDISISGTPLLARFESGEVIAYGPGQNLTPGGGDDVALRIDAEANAEEFSSARDWGHGLPPQSLGGRMIAVSAGLDGTPGTGDEEIIVHIAPGLGDEAGDTAALRLWASIAAPGAAHPLTALGINYGLMQMPGGGGFYFVVRY